MQRELLLHKLTDAEIQERTNNNAFETEAVIEGLLEMHASRGVLEKSMPVTSV